VGEKSDFRLSPDTIVSATKEQVGVTLGEDMVILSLSDGVYYGLNEVGQDIWAMLENPVKVRDICTKVMELYDVPEPVCEHDVHALLEQLAERRLIVIHSDDVK
jgi:hypothetical protein